MMSQKLLAFLIFASYTTVARAANGKLKCSLVYGKRFSESEVRLSVTSETSNAEHSITFVVMIDDDNDNRSFHSINTAIIASMIVK